MQQHSIRPESWKPMAVPLIDDGMVMKPVDMVQNVKSGHPSTPMDAATLVYVLWDRFLKYHLRTPTWADRDRFILSPGHASALLYSLLYLTGYGLLPSSACTGCATGKLSGDRRFARWGKSGAGNWYERGRGQHTFHTPADYFRPSASWTTPASCRMSLPGSVRNENTKAQKDLRDLANAIS